jgi:hypothetical protein
MLLIFSLEVDEIEDETAKTKNIYKGYKKQREREQESSERPM